MTEMIALSGVGIVALFTPPDSRQVERGLALIDAYKSAQNPKNINRSVPGGDQRSAISVFARRLQMWNRRQEP